MAKTAGDATRDRSTPPAGAERKPTSPAGRAGTQPAARRRLRRPPLPWVLVAAMTVLAVVFAVLWQVAESGKGRATAADRVRAEVAETATRFLGVLTNFKGATISGDVGRIRSFATLGFARQVDQLFSPAVVSALRRTNVVSVGKVQSVFVESVSGSQAEVFGVVAETRSTLGASPQSETLRMDVQMIQTPSGWKVSNLDLLQSPGGSTPLG